MKNNIIKPNFLFIDIEFIGVLAEQLNTMRYRLIRLIILSGLLLASCSEKNRNQTILSSLDGLITTKVGLVESSSQAEFAKKWNSGNKNCIEPHYQIQSLPEKQFTIRQSKCLHYEAPFIHVIIGNEKIFVMDTGAVESQAFELINLIFDMASLISPNQDLKMWLAHTHSHQDHTAGDFEFQKNDRVEFVGHEVEKILSAYKLKDWPNGTSIINLGERLIDVIPIPGHDETSLAFYDRQSKILYTGDSLYPGRIYIQNFQEFKKSIIRLIEFSKNFEIRAILGTHIELSEDYLTDYPPRSKYHPTEAPLQLDLTDLIEIHEALKTAKPSDLVKLKKVILYPNFAL